MPSYCKQRILLPFLALLLLGPALQYGVAANLKDFLSSRQVVDSVYFAAGSSELDQIARDRIGNLVERLRTVDTRKKVVRLEGFSSPSGADAKNIDLSMKRAMAVETYLQDKFHLPRTRYLVGRGVDLDPSRPDRERRRVDVVFYDNLLNLDNAEVEKIIIDGVNED